MNKPPAISRRNPCTGGMLTGWTVSDKAFVAYTILPEPGGWPLLITPKARKVEPTGALQKLNTPSNPSARRMGNNAVRRIVPETSKIHGDIPNGSLVRLVFQKIKRDVFIVMIAWCLNTNNQR